MEKQLKKLQEYVDSLESNQLSEEQEALLMVGKSEELCAEGNSRCENRYLSCDGSINSGKCTNITSTGCKGSINKTCTMAPPTP